ncbi:hypothetical protein L1887_48063 [Cichorium endivia]|nr:hypothetical protein L1887_48063 [Cichorium endivia]
MRVFAKIRSPELAGRTARTCFSPPTAPISFSTHHTFPNHSRALRFTHNAGIYTGGDWVRHDGCCHPLGRAGFATVAAGACLDGIVRLLAPRLDCRRRPDRASHHATSPLSTRLESVRRLKKVFADYPDIAIHAGKNVQAAQEADVILLGCKPQMVQDIIAEPGMREALDGKLVISICAGLRISQMVRMGDSRHQGGEGHAKHPLQDPRGHDDPHPAAVVVAKRRAGSQHSAVHLQRCGQVQVPGREAL